MKLNYYEIGNRIRDIREELDLSQAAFAEMTGISREHMGRIERNPKNPSIELLANISYCTGYSVDYILFGHTYPNPDQRQAMIKNEITKVIVEMKNLLDKV